MHLGEWKLYIEHWCQSLLLGTIIIIITGNLYLRYTHIVTTVNATEAGNDSSGDLLTHYIIVGIIFAAVVLVAIISFIVYVLITQHKHAKKK